MDPKFVIEMLQNVIRHWNTNDISNKNSLKRTNDEILAQLKTPSKLSTRFVCRCFAVGSLIHYVYLYVSYHQ